MQKESELPWFKFFPAKFLLSGKVELMSTRSVGAYMLLLCRAWTEKPPASIPTNDTILSRWARLSEADWTDCKEEVLSAFDLQDGRYHQSTLRREYDAAVRERKVRAKNGAKGASKRWEGHSPAIGEPSGSDGIKEGDGERELEKKPLRKNPPPGFAGTGSELAAAGVSSKKAEELIHANPQLSAIDVILEVEDIARGKSARSIPSVLVSRLSDVGFIPRTLISPPDVTRLVSVHGRRLISIAGVEINGAKLGQNSKGVYLGEKLIATPAQLTPSAIVIARGK